MSAAGTSQVGTHTSETDTAFPAPAGNETGAPYWQALAEGRLVFQRCDTCGHAWLPARRECPRCLASAAQWAAASGRAKLVSWVVYHHGYHPYYATRLPYNVAVVELAEGPRLISNVVDAKHLRLDMPLILVIEREAGVALARFRPAQPALQPGGEPSCNEDALPEH